MAKHKSAMKANRQSEKRNLHNRDIRSSVKTAVKALEQKLEAGRKNPESVKELLPPMLNKVQQLLMRAGRKSIIHPKTASRKISRLSTAVNKTVS